MRRLILALALALAALAPVPDAVRAQESTLNLQGADIRAFIQDVARATGQTFIIDPRVRGTVTIASEEPLSRTELFEVMLSTLRANGLIAIPAGRGVYRIAPEEGAAQQPATLGAAAGYGFTTQVFRLRRADASAAAEMLKPLVGRNGVVQASRRGNLLFVADYGDNLRRIRTLVAELDQDRSLTETVTLRSSSAREIAGVVNELLKSPGEEPGARNPLVSVVVVESSNSLLLRGPPEAVRPLLPLIADLDRRAEASGDVRVVHLRHANADQLLPVLQQIVGQAPAVSAAPAQQGATGTAAAAAPAAAAFVTGGGRATIARFAGANAIVIAADPETQRTLGEVVRQLDVRREQVLVEAIVVEVSDEAVKRLGVQFALSGRDGSAVPFVATSYSNAAPSLAALAGAIAARNQLPEGSDTRQFLEDAAVRSVLAANGFLAGGVGRTSDALFGFVINAVKSDQGSNLLSTPSIMTLDNQEATILVGQEVPITTGEVLGDSNSNPFRTIQRQNVGVQLEVKPQVNAGGAVTLHLRQEVSSIAGPVSSAFAELILNKRELETTVTVDDGEIVVLGGLLDQNERADAQRTPVLGDVPGLGALFRSKGRTRGRTNLMVFIRPTIIRSSADARAATAPRYGFIRDEQARRSATGVSDLDELVRHYMGAQPPSAAPPSAVPPPPPPPPPGEARP